MTGKCAACGQALKPAAIDRRLRRAAHNTDFDTGMCKTCHAPIIAGWTDGIPIVLDPTPLNAIGEMAATTLGAHTYQRRAARFRARDSYHRRAPFPNRPETVHAPHCCGRVWPPELTMPPPSATPHDKPTQPTQQPEQPNF